MLPVLVCCTVVQRPIQTRWPMPTCDGHVAPTTKHVTGRGVQPTSVINILWLCGAVSEPPVINHFVPLLPVSVVSSCVDVTAGHTDSEDSDIATPIVDIFASHVGGLLMATGVSSFVSHSKCTKRSELQLIPGAKKSMSLSAVVFS